MMAITPDQARAALAAKGTAELNLARLAQCPPWRHAAFGGVEAALVATPAFALPLRFATLAMILIAVALIVQSDKRRLGVFINGYRRGKTRLVTFPMLGLLMIFYGASCYFGLARGEHSVSLALAVPAFVTGWAGSVLWQRVFVRELGA